MAPILIIVDIGKNRGKNDYSDSIFVWTAGQKVASEREVNSMHIIFLSA